ncbi:hypothetical protein HC175_02490 [Salinimicrobium sp. CDJ15-91]|uniref:Uncharacterized protein n=1 Tax=Salinimicrobium oceani TaxID=2722702 RepID=A0ABX1CV52_9FLAO|nr:hypothetical protein [Salinimicrobium oceani]
MSKKRLERRIGNIRSEQLEFIKETLNDILRY